MASRKKQFQKQQRKAQRKQQKVKIEDSNAGEEEETPFVDQSQFIDQDNNADIPGSTKEENNSSSSSETEEEEISEEEKSEEEKQDSKDEAKAKVGEIKFVVANDLRKGGFVLLRNGSHPCKLMGLKKAKTGKHGGAKIRVVGIDIISGKKYDDIFLSKEQVSVPAVKKVKYDVVGIEKNEWVILKEVVPSAAATVVEGVGEKKMKINEEGNEIHASLIEKFRNGKASVIVVTAMGEDAIVEVRSG